MMKLFRPLFLIQGVGKGRATQLVAQTFFLCNDQNGPDSHVTHSFNGPDLNCTKYHWPYSKLAHGNI